MPQRNIVASLVCGTAVVAAVVLARAAGEAPRYADHSRPLVYVDDGARERAVKTPEDWAKRRKHILAGMQEAMGELPSREDLPPLDPKVDEEVPGEGFTRLKLSLVAERTKDGKEDRIPA